MKILSIYIITVFVGILIGSFGKRTVISCMDRKHTTVCKGLAGLLIVLCHIAGDYTSLRYFTPLGGIGVSMFLLTSGYGLRKSYEKDGLKNYWKKRFINVWIPYFFCAMFSMFFFHTYLVKEFLLDILLIFPKYRYGWYLQYLMLWYIIFWLVYRLCSTKIRNKVIIVVAVVMFIVLPEIMAEQSLSFVAGIYIAQIDNDKLSSKESNKVAIVALLIGIVSLCIKQLPLVRQSYGIVMKLVQLYIKLPLGIFLLFCTQEIKAVFSNRFWFYMGEVSYELYLVHGYIFAAFPDNSWGNGVKIVILVFIVTLLFSVINRFLSGRMKYLLYERKES